MNYIIDDKVIDDSLCPKCFEKIDDDTEFCQCGFYVTAAKNAASYSFMFFLAVAMVSSSLIMSKTGFFGLLGVNVSSKVVNAEMSSVAAPSIQVENTMKTSGMFSMIRNIYPQDYKNKNILIVFVKPEYWPSMKPDDRSKLHNSIEVLWRKAYKGQDPQVRFANE
jgi:hypothetical protein